MHLLVLDCVTSFQTQEEAAKELKAKQKEELEKLKAADLSQ